MKFSSLLQEEAMELFHLHIWVKMLLQKELLFATDYREGGFFISEKLNGPWRGILILDRNAKVQRGDYVKTTGTVSEYYGMTCLPNISKQSAQY